MVDPIKGRGALSNPDGRFERATREAVDDGWYREEEPDPRTEVRVDTARRVITTNDSPDVPFDYSINPYRGCEHGCVYCFARPTHEYLGLSAGLDFETKLYCKPDAPALLEAELARPGYACRPIMLGSNTDPYQPVERELRITRGILEVLARCRHPVSIVTKGSLVMRDLDVLADLARHGLVTVAVSVTTLDDATKRTLEPRAASPAARLRVIRALADAGVPVGVMVAPVIPAITDHELESILARAAEAGARSAAYVLLRLPHGVKDLYREWLAAHRPESAGRALAVLREARGGRDNDPCFGTRMRGGGAWADLLRARFVLACRKLGLETGREIRLPVDSFRPPGGAQPQMCLDLPDPGPGRGSTEAGGAR